MYGSDRSCKKQPRLERYIPLFCCGKFLWNLFYHKTHDVRGCAARGNEMTALQSARARRLRQAHSFFLFHIADKCISASGNHRAHLIHTYRQFFPAVRVHISNTLDTIPRQQDRMTGISHCDHRHSFVDDI